MSDPLPSELTPGPDHADPEYEIQKPGTVEPKTSAAAAAAGASTIVTGFVLYLLDALIWNGEAEPPVPLPIQLFVGLVVVTGSTFWASYSARHVNRVE